YVGLHCAGTGLLGVPMGGICTSSAYFHPVEFAFDSHAAALEALQLEPPAAVTSKNTASNCELGELVLAAMHSLPGAVPTETPFSTATFAAVRTTPPAA